jgi:serine protease Do
VQANVRLAPGNSGGPLADSQGRVVGINTMVAGGLALAIPSNSVRDFLSVGPANAWLGVTLRPAMIPRSADKEKTFGLVILEIEPGSPADQASLLPGDILLGTEEKKFTAIEDLADRLRGGAARVLRVEFLRGDYRKTRKVTVQLGATWPAKKAAA